MNEYTVTWEFEGEPREQRFQAVNDKKAVKHAVKISGFDEIQPNNGVANVRVARVIGEF